MYISPNGLDSHVDVSIPLSCCAMRSIICSPLACDPEILLLHEIVEISPDCISDHELVDVMICVLL